MHKFKKGDKVLVCEPTIDDMWNHSFVGSITCLGPQYAVVVDQDDDAFAVDYSSMVRYNLIKGA